MDMASQSKVSTTRKLAVVALGISLIGHMAISPCLALGLSSSKKTSLQYEVYSKLSSGAGPATNDLKKQEPKMDTEAAKPVDLSPVTIDEGNKSDTALGPAEEGMLKATVKRQNVMTSGPIEQANLLAPTSLKHSVGEKVLSRDRSLHQNAAQVNLMPTPLQASSEEEAAKGDAKLSAEKLELADLWDSTLARSQDIQFVVQKLMPNSNSGKTASVLMKMLSATVYGGMGMMMMTAPNMGAQMGANMGASLLMQGLNGIQGNADKRARLSQTEAIMLYTIVRNTADKLVEAFRTYKIELSDLQRSTDNLTKLQEMVKDVRASQTPAEQIKMEGELMKYQSEVDKKNEQVNRFRQSLVDLSGAEAVAKLDKQLEADRQNITSMIASPTVSDQTAGPSGPAM